MGYSKNSTFLDGHVNAGQSFITFFPFEASDRDTTKISKHILKCQSHDT